MKEFSGAFEFTRRDRQLARLADEGQRLLQLNKWLQGELPGALAGRCQVARQEGGELLVFASSGMVASRLKMMAPQILARLEQHGMLLHTLRVRVGPVVQPPVKENRLKIGETGLQALEAALPSVEDKGLQRALALLVRHQRAKNVK